MKLTCNRESLLAAVNKVVAAVASRTTKPILSCIKATADGDTLTLVATDLELGVRYVVRGVEVHDPGEAILAPLLQGILRESVADESLCITADDNGASVSIGSSKFTLPGWPAAEFPDVASVDSTNYHEVTAGVLKSLIARTSYAADKKDSTRFTLSGVLWEVSPKTVRLIATDSKRLAVAEGPASLYGEHDDVTVNGRYSHLIPAKAIALLQKNLDDDGEELVKVTLKPNEAQFATEQWTLYTRLLEGRYPPWRDIIKQTVRAAGTKIVLPVGPFLARLKQAAVMTDDTSKRVELSFGHGSVFISAKGAETGKSDVEMPLPRYDGPPVDVAMDPSYVREFLQVMTHGKVGEVVLHMADGTKPVLFEAGESRYLVMPLTG